MNITGPQLVDEYTNAFNKWSFIHTIERQYHLVSCTLFAVGSRETNLTNEVGDNGHGHGVWQLDDRSHTIPAGFDNNVNEQCVTAAKMLQGLLAHFAGKYAPAFAAYNAGVGTVKYNLDHGLNVDTGTAGNDYSGDVLGRMHYLQGWVGTSMSRTISDDDVAAIVAKIKTMTIDLRKPAVPTTLDNLFAVWHEQFEKVQKKVLG